MTLYYPFSATFTNFDGVAVDPSLLSTPTLSSSSESAPSSPNELLAPLPAPIIPSVRRKAPSSVHSTSISSSSHDMSEGSSHKGRHLRRGEQLRRNAACTQCRKRRTKCDAVRPHCSACVRHHAYLLKTHTEGAEHGVGCCYEDEGESTPVEAASAPLPTPVSLPLPSEAGPSRRRGSRIARRKRPSTSASSENGTVAAAGAPMTDLVARVAELQAELDSRASPALNGYSTSGSTSAPSPYPSGIPLGFSPNPFDNMSHTLPLPPPGYSEFTLDDTFDPFAFGLEDPSTYGILPDFGLVESPVANTAPMPLTLPPPEPTPAPAAPIPQLVPPSSSNYIPMVTTLFPTIAPDRRASAPLAYTRAQMPMFLPHAFGPPLVHAPSAPYGTWDNTTPLPGTSAPVAPPETLFPASAALFQQAMQSVRPHSLEEVLRMNQTMMQRPLMQGALSGGGTDGSGQGKDGGLGLFMSPNGTGNGNRGTKGSRGSM